MLVETWAAKQLRSPPPGLAAVGDVRVHLNLVTVLSWAHILGMHPVGRQLCEDDVWDVQELQAPGWGVKRT